MKTFKTKSQLEQQPQTPPQKEHQAGEIYSQIFEHDKFADESNFKKIEIGIIWLGSFMFKSDIFPKITCPVCKKENCLIPYQVVGSILSGAHTIKFYCENCQEKIVTNDYIEYFRIIYKYVLKNKNNFNKNDILNNCTIIDNSNETY